MSIGERFVVQCIVCGVAIAALLSAHVVGLPFTERFRADAANSLMADYTDRLPLAPVITAAEQVRYIVFDEAARPEERAAYIPEPPHEPDPAPALLPSVDHDTPLSYEANENNTFYDFHSDDRLFIEDIIRQIHEAGQEGRVADELPDNYTQNIPAPPIPPGQARVSSPFGYRTNPVTGQREKHNGVDMAFYHGTPVVAIQDGVITDIGYNAYSGNYVRYRTSDGLLVGYAHLYQVTVQVGDVVNRGDTIALTGNSGLSTGPHLHVTIWRDGTTIDPLTVFAVN